jgi:hypothetical protein
LTILSQENLKDLFIPSFPIISGFRERLHIVLFSLKTLYQYILADGVCFITNDYYMRCYDKEGNTSIAPSISPAHARYLYSASEYLFGSGYAHRVWKALLRTAYERCDDSRCRSMYDFLRISSEIGFEHGYDAMVEFWRRKGVIDSLAREKEPNPMRRDFLAQLVLRIMNTDRSEPGTRLRNRFLKHLYMRLLEIPLIRASHSTDRYVFGRSHIYLSNKIYVSACGHIFTCSSWDTVKSFSCVYIDTELGSGDHLPLLIDLEGRECIDAGELLYTYVSRNVFNEFMLPKHSSRIYKIYFEKRFDECFNRLALGFYGTPLSKIPFDQVMRASIWWDENRYRVWWELIIPATFLILSSLIRHREGRGIGGLIEEILMRASRKRKPPEEIPEGVLENLIFFISYNNKYYIP